MGILDLPSPLLSAADRWLTEVMPPLARLLVWAAVGALISMELYRLLSPQKRIAGIKAALIEERRVLVDFDGELGEAWPMMRRMLGFAVRRVLIVLPATIVASLPLLVFIVWLDSHYGGAYPPRGTPVNVEVPAGFQAQWRDQGTEAAPRAVVRDLEGRPVAEVPVAAPIPEIHKWQWWNTLIGNPAGYLRDELPIDRIEIALPRQQFLDIGPAWMRGWEVTFFTALILFAITFKYARRIE